MTELEVVVVKGIVYNAFVRRRERIQMFTDNSAVPLATIKSLKTSDAYIRKCISKCHFVLDWCSNYAVLCFYLSAMAQTGCACAVRLGK